MGRGLVLALVLTFIADIVTAVALEMRVVSEGRSVLEKCSVSEDFGRALAFLPRLLPLPSLLNQRLSLGLL